MDPPVTGSENFFSREIGPADGLYLDITYEAVPEPGTLGLMALALPGLMLWRKWRKTEQVWLR